MQLVFGDAYLRQRKDAARLEEMPLAAFAARLVDAVEQLASDPLIGALHQVEAGNVTRLVSIEETTHVLLYQLVGHDTIRLLGIVEASALDTLRTREELVVPDQLSTTLLC